MGLHLHGASDTEHLFEVFLKERDLFGSGGPSMSEVVVVQNRSMFEWLSLGVAKRDSIAFNLKPFFLSTFLEHVYRSLNGVPPWRSYSFYSPNTLVWTLTSLLQGILHRPNPSVVFQPIRAYLESQDNQSAPFALARRLAEIYNKYLVFRHRTVLGWESNPSAPSTWQEFLWRMVVKRSSEPHLLHMRQSALTALKGESLTEAGTLSVGATKNLPARIALFGMASIPNFYTDFFLALSERIEVHVYLTTAFDARKGRSPFPSYVTLSEQTWSDWIRSASPKSVEVGLPEPTTTTTMLGLVRRRYLGGEAAPAPSTLDAFRLGSDTSVRLHASPSTFREVEVLRHNLLALFEEGHYKPSDVLVAAPDMKTYVPWVRVVFANPEHESMSIPFRIASKGLAGDSIERDFLALLVLVKRRLTFPEVFEFLSRPNAQEGLNLSESEVERLGDCFKEMNTYWGLGSEREDDLPPFEAGSWSLALKRMLASYGLAPDPSKSFGSIAVAEHPMSPEDYDALGGVARFAEALSKAKKAFVVPADLKTWRVRLLQLASTCLGTRDHEVGSPSIARALNGLAGLQATTNFHQKVPMEWVELHLKESLEKAPKAQAVGSDSVLFSDMLDSRGLPFKVVCLLGLNGVASPSPPFPRKESLLPFDLMKEQPEPSDWSKREEDMLLFLEHLVACKGVLLLSYNGGDPKAGQSSLPSVVVQDLEEVVKSFYAPELQQEAAGRLHAQHPANGFDVLYFSGDDSGKFKNYSKLDYETAKLLSSQSAPQAKEAVLVRRKKEVGEEGLAGRVVRVNDLVRFFRNPTQSFYSEQLGLRLSSPKEEGASHEPFEIENLLRYGLTKTLLDRPELDSLDEAYDYFARRSSVPLGEIGKRFFSQIFFSAREHLDLIDRLRGGAAKSISGELDLDDLQLADSIEVFGDGRLIHSKASSFKGKDLWAPWISSLFLASLPSFKPSSAEAFLVASPGKGKPPEVYRFGAEGSSARSHLKKLIDTYRTSLGECIPFFASASYEYMRSMTGRKPNEKQAIEKAEETYKRGDKAYDDWVGFAYRYASPFEAGLLDAFKSWAESILGPLLREGAFKKLGKAELEKL